MGVACSTLNFLSKDKAAYSLLVGFPEKTFLVQVDLTRVPVFNGYNFMNAHFQKIFKIRPPKGGMTSPRFKCGEIIIK